jgi:hypothetical protein
MDCLTKEEAISLIKMIRTVEGEDSNYVLDSYSRENIRIIGKLLSIII